MADVLETRPTTQHGHPRAYSACVLVACIQEVAQYRLSAMLHSSYPQESALAISRDPGGSHAQRVARACSALPSRAGLARDVGQLIRSRRITGLSRSRRLAGAARRL